jgi:hypothetical protein
MTSRLGGVLRGATDDGFVLALRLTLVDLLLRPVGDWTVRPFVLVLAAAGLLIPGLLQRASLWWALTVLTGLRVVSDWPLPDNHAYLLCYWCFAVAIAVSARGSRQIAAAAGRWLIGLSFAFASLWKLALSPDFLDGTFFRVTLATDPRFADFTRLLGGVSAQALEALRSALEQHADLGVLAEVVPPVPLPYERLADAMTWWTAAIEAAVAVAFLWPGTRGLARTRDACLLVFCATTYAVATVDGFGWLLVAMGVAQTPPERRGTRMVYLVVFVAILFYRETPWLNLLADRFAV